MYNTMSVRKKTFSVNKLFYLYKYILIFFLAHIYKLDQWKETRYIFYYKKKNLSNDPQWEESPRKRGQKQRKDNWELKVLSYLVKSI